jgi:hypothetical protein
MRRTRLVQDVHSNVEILALASSELFTGDCVGQLRGGRRLRARFRVKLLQEV